MAIKVTLSSGITSAKTTSLFQWDYGQQLQIISDDLPPIVEVHFACKGMSEAVVMPCSITDGTGIVTIPDSCLEQSTDITAWVYSIDGTQGKTVKTITIPIVSRTRPGRSETIPQSVTDKYTELISQVNDAINDLKDGTVVVKTATTAETAKKAASATNADFANMANGVRINGKTPFPEPVDVVTRLPGAGYYCIVPIFYEAPQAPVILYWDGVNDNSFAMGEIYALSNGTIHQNAIMIGRDGMLSAIEIVPEQYTAEDLQNYTFKVAKLWG